LAVAFGKGKKKTLALKNFLAACSLLDI